MQLMYVVSQCLIPLCFLIWFIFRISNVLHIYICGKKIQKKIKKPADASTTPLINMFQNISQSKYTGNVLADTIKTKVTLLKLHV